MQLSQAGHAPFPLRRDLKPRAHSSGYDKHQPSAQWPLGRRLDELDWADHGRAEAERFREICDADARLP